MNSRASWAAVGCGGRLVVAVSAAEASARAASAACLDAARSRCRPSSVTPSFSRSWVSGARHGDGHSGPLVYVPSCGRDLLHGVGFGVDDAGQVADDRSGQLGQRVLDRQDQVIDDVVIQWAVGFEDEHSFCGV